MEEVKRTFKSHSDTLVYCKMEQLETSMQQSNLECFPKTQGRVSSQLPLVSETSSSTQNANMTYRQPALKSSITPKHQSRILALPSHPSDTSAVIVEWKPPKFLPHVQAQAKENAKLTNPMLDGMRAEHERKLEELENEKAAALKRDHQDADEVLDGLDEIFEPTLKN